MKNILAADIGGTHSRFAHFTVGQTGNPALEEMKWLKTANAGSFRQLLDNLKRSGMSLQAAEADIVVIAIAGPVEKAVRSAGEIFETYLLRKCLVPERIGYPDSRMKFLTVIYS